MGEIRMHFKKRLLIRPFFQIHWPLMLIIAFGAFLRLTWLSTPSLSIDEAGVYRRVCGSLHQLFEQLALTGFVPLHYLGYWVLGKIAPLTPTVMRLPPAIAGILTIPAMYWLSLQIVRCRRTALVVALFAACSAFLNNYSRDAKMYSECWFYLTLNVASLLWFLDSRRWRAGCLWIITALLMAATYTVSAMVLPIELIMVLTHTKAHWKTALFFVLGLVMVAVPLLAYYFLFNHFHERLSNDWHTSGLMWISNYNHGRHIPDLFRYTATHFLFNWEWPKFQDVKAVPENVLRLCTFISILLGVLISAGLLPWRRSVDMTIKWRTLLWIGAWCILPTYVVLCASKASSPPPWTWPWAILTSPCGVLTLALLLLATIRFPGTSWPERLRMLRPPILVLFSLLTLCSIIYIAVPVQHGSLWIPRYLGIVWPAFAIAVVLLLMRLPTRPVRWFAISAVMLVNVSDWGARIFVCTHPPTELIATDILVDQRPDSPVRTYCELDGLRLFGRSTPGITASGPYYLFILSGINTTPDDYAKRYDQIFRLRDLHPGNEKIILNEISQNPQIKKIILWDEVSEYDKTQPDPLQKKLRMEWKRTGNQIFPMYEHWTWREIPILRRRVYEQLPSAKPEDWIVNETNPKNFHGNLFKNIPFMNAKK
jgi:hypothetical protein